MTGFTLIASIPKELHIIKTLVLYIIKPTEIHTNGVMRYNNGEPLLVIYTTAS